VSPPRLKAGVVSDLRGTASATAPDGSRRDLEPGGIVYNGDILQTGEGSLLRLAMTDRSMYTVGENSRIEIKDFKYQEAAPAQDSSHLSLVRGTFRFLTGLIGKRSPDKVAYETPVATIGIRGTEGEVEYDDVHHVFHLCVLRDAVLLHLLKKLVWTVPAGQGVTLRLDPKTGVISAEVDCHCTPLLPGVVPGAEGIGERLFYPYGNAGGAVASPS
jgi:FecR protein